jgi:hypothetical protein
MFYQFTGIPSSGGSPGTIYLDVTRVSAYYKTTPTITTVRCDGTDFLLVTPFEQIHNSILEGRADNILGDSITPNELGYRP